MNKVVRDESRRRALAHLARSPSGHCDEAEGTAWMDSSLCESVREALRTAWILDIDTTIKLLYGHQAGTEINYNPTKPGRPSHTLHTDWIGNLRLVLDVEVQGGKAHGARHTLPGLRRIIERRAPEQRPSLVRGDNAFGNDPVMAEMEAIEQPYLFKLRQTAGVKRLIERQCSRGDWEDPAQQLLQFIDEGEDLKVWEYAVVVTNPVYPLPALGELYRDRADCENGFDGLKNPWGWGGYTTEELERCNLSVCAVGLIYNRWNWYVRLAHPEARLEAIHQPPAAAQRCCPPHPARRAVPAVAHAHPCRGGPDQSDDHQYPQGSKLCPGKCASIAQATAMARPGALHPQQNPLR